MPKHYNLQNVYDASIERLEFVFNNFENVYLSFSGGKDSGVMFNLALNVARKMGKLPLKVLYVDLEAQYQSTIEYVESVMLNPDVEGYWICLPLHLRNAVSQVHPHWLCWDDSEKNNWVREIPLHDCVISDVNYFNFFRKGMEFEEFVPLFGEWISKGNNTACLVGIRSDESLNRFRTIASTTKTAFKEKQYTTKVTDNVYNAYPIYDWRTQDIWKANGCFEWKYNRIYDLMHLAGLSIHEMRICQPYGDDQRKGLWLFKILEPQTWVKVVARVEGANFGNKYSGDKALGNFVIELPKGHTYKTYAKFLLSTLPPHIEEHYRKKIYKFLKYWKKHKEELPNKSFPDAGDRKLEASRKVGSWRRIVKVLLKNDYWCKGLSFSQTKREMERQMDVVSRCYNNF